MGPPGNDCICLKEAKCRNLQLNGKVTVRVTLQDLGKVHLMNHGEPWAPHPLYIPRLPGYPVLIIEAGPSSVQGTKQLPQILAYRREGRDAAEESPSASLTHTHLMKASSLLHMSIFTLPQGHSRLKLLPESEVTGNIFPSYQSSLPATE